MTDKRKKLFAAQQKQTNRSAYNAQVRDASRQVIDGQDGRPLMVALDQIAPGSHQPRTEFEEERLNELAATIKEQGVLQPIVVRQEGDRMVIIAGERRWRAAKLAGLKEIPAILKQAGDARVLALIENVQRENLNPKDLAQSLKALKDEHSYTDDQLAALLGKSRVRITEFLALNRLPERVLAAMSDVRHSPASILEVARQKTPKEMVALWEKMQETGASTVRAVRSLARPKQKAQAKGYVYKNRGDGYTLQIAFTDSKVDKRLVQQTLLREAKKALQDKG